MEILKDPFIQLLAVGIGVFGFLYLCGRMGSGVTKKTVRTNEHLRINANAWLVAAICGLIASPILLVNNPANPIAWIWGISTIVAIFVWRFWSRECHDNEIKKPLQENRNKFEE